MPGSKIIGIIPARYNSSRFEGKPLALINKIPMIKRTYQQVEKCKKLNKIIVATDDKKIEEYCNLENIPVIMTSNTSLTGTDRLAEIAKKLDYDLYINIQGDEPVIDPLAIDEIIDIHNKYKEYHVYNLYKVISDKNEINSSTIVKVVVNQNEEAMYMSRLPIPYSNSNLESIYKQHIPIYGFTKKALQVFSQRGKTINEVFEDVELLRFIDLGYKVKMKETYVDSISVDIPSDIKKVENFLDKKLQIK